MKDYYIDATKVALSIQKEDFSFLRGKEFKIRDKIKKGKCMKKTRKKKSRVTLAMIASDLADLKRDVKNINARLDYNHLKKLPETSK